MTQQTDRLDVVREAIQDVQFIRANFTKQYINRMERELIEDLHKRLWSIEAALSQPAAHPEPDNAGALEVPSGYVHSPTLANAYKRGYEAALAKPAVKEIEGLEGAVNCKWCKFWNTRSKQTHAAIIYQAAREYLKLSGQKEGE